MSQVLFENFDDLVAAVSQTPLIDPLLDSGIYNLVVKSARKVPSTGRPGAFNYLLIIGSVDHPEATDMFEYLPIPTGADEPKAKHFMLQKMAQFCAASHLPVTAFKGVTDSGGDEQLVGVTFPAKVGRQEAQTDEATGKTYKPKNVIEEYIFSTQS